MVDVRPMKEATYYLRVSVNGAQLPMADYCGNNPTGASCSFTVSWNLWCLLDKFGK